MTETECTCSWKDAPAVSPHHDGDCAVNYPPHPSDCECRWHQEDSRKGQSTLPAILAALLVAGLLFASVELGAARVAAALFAVGY